jgi:hypothetical protein
MLVHWFLLAHYFQSFDLCFLQIICLGLYRAPQQRLGSLFPYLYLSPPVSGVKSLILYNMTNVYVLIICSPSSIVPVHIYICCVHSYSFLFCTWCFIHRHYLFVLYMQGCAELYASDRAFVFGSYSRLTAAMDSFPVDDDGDGDGDECGDEDNEWNGDECDDSDQT